jgi:hypothetical protein
VAAGRNIVAQTIRGPGPVSTTKSGGSPKTALSHE